MKLLPASELRPLLPASSTAFPAFRLFAVLFFAWSASIFSVQAQCPAAALTLSSQAEVNSFPSDYPGCTVLPVSLTISGGDIANLNALSVLTSLSGTSSLELVDNPALTSISGLSNLTSIGGSLAISNNDALTNLSGFGSLASIGFSLNVEGNQVLTTLGGLSNVSSLGGDLDVEFNPSLTSFGGGLNNIPSLGGILQINNNGAMTTLNGLNALTSVGQYLFISSNGALTSVNGLSSLSSVGGDFEISNCLNMTSLGGLTNLSSISGSFNLFVDIKLTNLNELDHPITIGGDLSLGFNSMLGDCAAQSVCDYLDNPPGIVAINNNASGCNTVVQVQTACGLLPVELMSFSAAIQNHAVKLLWSTASEKDNRGYYLERSADGQNWASIGFVAGKGTVEHRMDYFFMDEKPLPGANYYRLMQTDIDGKYSYSNIVVVDMRPGAEPFDVFPNPAANGVVSVRAESQVEGDGHPEIFDWTGARVYDRFLSFPEGALVYPVSLSSLPRGAYSVRLETPDGVVHFKKIVLQ